MITACGLAECHDALHVAAVLRKAINPFPELKPSAALCLVCGDIPVDVPLKKCHGELGVAVILVHDGRRVAELQILHPAAIPNGVSPSSAIDNSILLVLQIRYPSTCWAHDGRTGHFTECSRTL